MHTIPKLTSTYRLQFSSQFTFSHATETLPYLARLGVSHIYASPIFAAMPGSSHGYNVVDHNRINPELGGMEGFRTLVERAHHYGLGWIQDIVPNHMAYSPRNPLLFDLFEHGRQSRYWRYFDIDWETPYQGLHGRVIAPFLGSLYGEVLERGEITLTYAEDGFHLNYYDMRFPLRIETYQTVLARHVARLERRLGHDDPEMLKLLGVLYTLDSLEAEQDAETRRDKSAFIKRMIWELYRDVPVVREYVDSAVAELNDGTPDGDYNALNELHWQQVYRLSHWKVAGEEINYRRFFSVNDLICLRVEDPEVFAHSHKLLFSLVHDGLVDGVRVDHIDGLYDPGEYLRRLRERLGERPVFVEKILHEGEQMPSEWPCNGTTGYESLVAVDRLFVDQRGTETLQRHYRSFAGVRGSVEGLLAAAKRRFITDHMAGDIENLARYIKRLLASDRRAIDITNRSLEAALAEVMVHFPVYRTYTTGRMNRAADRDYVRTAVGLARSHRSDYGYELDYIEHLLLLEVSDHHNAESLSRWRDVVQRFQQFTGPLMAKGLEDTVMYSYVPLLSANEVGGDPALLSATPEQFHRFASELSPATMTSGSTHDTKRGEDTRLRIAMISHMSERWATSTRAWRDENRRFKRRVSRAAAPDANDEYMIYQLLVAMVPADGTPDDALCERLETYLTKALREAKRHTSWVQVNQRYEQAAQGFLRALLGALSEPPRHGERAAYGFAASFRDLAATVHAWADSLIRSRTVIRMLMPGIPDTYRGSEVRDLTLVDPDNRRPVDFASHGHLLATVDKHCAATDPDAQKVHLVAALLDLRRRYASVVSDAPYLPLDTNASDSSSALSFARGADRSIVVVALLGPTESPVRIAMPGFDQGVAYTVVGQSRKLVTSAEGVLTVALDLDNPGLALVRT